MIKAVPIPPIFDVIAFSYSFHVLLNPIIPISIQKAVAASKQTWLPPAYASLPNIYMVIANITTNTRIGVNDKKGEGKEFLFILQVLLIIWVQISVYFLSFTSSYI